MTTCLHAEVSMGLIGSPSGYDNTRRTKLPHKGKWLYIAWCKNCGAKGEFDNNDVTRYTKLGRPIEELCRKAIKRQVQSLHDESVTCK